MPRNKMNYVQLRAKALNKKEVINRIFLPHYVSLAKGDVLGLTPDQDKESRQKSRKLGQPKGARAMVFCEGCGKAMKRAFHRWHIFRGECTGKKGVKGGTGNK